MIKITHYPKFNQVTIEGHAGAGPEGHDLICAAVSGIWHTLAANAMCWKDSGYLMDMRVQEIEGYCQLSWAPRSRYKNILTTIANAIVLGLEVIARDNPDHVQFVRMG